LGFVHRSPWSTTPTKKCLRSRVRTSVVNRYYDPATGQFVSVDPDVSETGQPYAYTGDNPINGTDPLGLCFLGGSWCNEIQNIVASNFDSFRHNTAAVADLPGYIIQGTGEAIYNAYVNIYQDGANSCSFLSFFSLGTQEDVGDALFADESAVLLGDGEGEVEDGVIALSEQATIHGTERLAQAGFTDESIAATKAGVVFQQDDGAIVYLNEVSPGRYDYIVEGDSGVITAHVNWPLKSIEGIASRYGWSEIP